VKLNCLKFKGAVVTIQGLEESEDDYIVIKAQK
jgi:hypothetical protein